MRLRNLKSVFNDLHQLLFIENALSKIGCNLKDATHSLVCYMDVPFHDQFCYVHVTKSVTGMGPFLFFTS